MPVLSRLAPRDPVVRPSSLAEEFGTSSVYLPREGLERVPIYHARGEYRSLRPEGDELRTACGIVVYRWQRGRIEKDATRLRLDHAGRFATPCRRCWRDADTTGLSVRTLEDLGLR